MTENFLCYLWQYRLFNFSIRTTCGLEVEVLNVGERNSDAGPDFSNALIRIGATIWAGQVEIHQRSSDWIKHKHAEDHQYDNVILHVVYESDVVIKRKSGEALFTIVLKDKFNQSLYETYLYFIKSNQWVPCSGMISSVHPFYINHCLERVLVDRLERRTEDFLLIFKECNYNWEDLFYRVIARCFGLTVNKDAFENLLRSLPIRYLARHKNNLFQIEAMIFGQAGFLEQSFNDDYPMQLKKEYQFIKKKFNLVPMKLHAWKFLRIRPDHFPTIRLAQLSYWIHQSSHICSLVLDCPPMESLVKMFETNASSYWDSHYLFDKPSEKKYCKQISEAMIRLIIVNGVIPFLVVYGKEKSQQQYIEKSLMYLSSLSPEENHIIRKWKHFGVLAQSAMQSQGLLELKKSYCDKKRCLECHIGHHLFTSS